MPMKKPFYILVLAFCFIALTNTDCKHNPVGPEIIQPGRRDYTWTFDTLHLQLGSLESIWGSSPADIWACGNEDLFHYDGTKWIRYTDFSGWSRTKLFGFSANDIWLGSTVGKLWHFDGTQWIEKYNYKPNDSSEANIDDIEGVNNNNIYATGCINVYNNSTSWFGFVLHYDGKTWKEIYRAQTASEFIKVKIDDGKVYIFNYRISPTRDMENDSISFYQFTNNNLKMLYTNVLSNITFGNMNNIGSRVYFVISHDVYRYDVPKRCNRQVCEIFFIPRTRFWILSLWTQ